VRYYNPNLSCFLLAPTKEISVALAHSSLLLVSRWREGPVRLCGSAYQGLHCQRVVLALHIRKENSNITPKAEQEQFTTAYGGGGGKNKVLFVFLW